MDFAEKPEERERLSKEAAEPIQPVVVPIQRVEEAPPPAVEPVPRFVV